MLNLVIWICLLTLLSFAAAYILIPDHKYKLAYAVFAIIALFLRFVIILYVYRDGCDTFGTDGLLYHQEGLKIARQLDAGISVFDVDYTYTWYTKFTGILYHVFGANRYYASFINAWMAFFSGLLLFVIAWRRQYSFRNCMFISLVFLYFPNMILWTADTRKEALMMMVSLLMWFFVQDLMMHGDQGKSRIRNGMRIVWVCLLIWLATMIRVYLFIPMAGGLVISQFIQYRSSKSRTCLVVIAAAVLTTAIVCIVTVYPSIQNHHAVRFPQPQDHDITENVEQKIVALEKIATKKDFITSVLDCLTLPHPGNVNISDIRGMKEVISLVRLDMIVWYLCLLLTVSGIYTAIKKKDGCFIGIFIYIVCYVLINALLVENEQGTILRYRAQIVGMTLLFIDWGMIRTMGNKLLSFRVGAPDLRHMRHMSK